MTIPGPTHGEQSRQAILQAAQDLFSGTSICQVARAADSALGATTDFRQDAMKYFVDNHLHGMLAATG